MPDTFSVQLNVTKLFPSFYSNLYKFMMDEKLPPELYAQIFQHLSQKELKEDVSLVCKKWYKLLPELCLVERSVNLDSPVSQSIAKASHDLKSYSTFASRVRTIKVNDFFEGKNQYENRFKDYELYSSFSDLVDLCPNLKKLKLCLNDLCYHGRLFRRLSTMNYSLTEGLNTLEIDLNNQNEWHVTRYFYIYIDLPKLVNRTIPGLQNLVFRSSSDVLEDDLKFVYKTSYSNECAIREIKIECPSAKITKSCLDSINAGNFPSLGNLHLFLTLIYSEDFEPYSSLEKVDGDTRFDELKNYCLTKLKAYNIFLFDETRSSCLFSMNNCAIVENAYSHIATKRGRAMFANFNA